MELERYSISISASEQILKTKTFGLALPMLQKFLGELENLLARRFSNKEPPLNYNLFPFYDFRKGGADVGRGIFRFGEGIARRADLKQDRINRILLIIRRGAQAGGS